MILILVERENDGVDYKLALNFTTGFNLVLNSYIDSDFIFVQPKFHFLSLVSNFNKQKSTDGASAALLRMVD